MPILGIPIPSTQASLVLDAGAHTATLRGGAGLQLRLNYAQGCTVDRLEVLGREVVGKGKGLWSGIQVGGKWFTSAQSVPPKVSRQGNRLTVAGIAYAGGGVRVAESWTLTAKADSVDWKIERKYLDAGTLDDSAMPMLGFSDMTTWTGALLGTGGVAWGKLLDAPNATYGIHTDSASLWNPASDACLAFKATSKSHRAMRFTREPEGGFSMAAQITGNELMPKRNKARFNRDGQDVWAPFSVSASEAISATFEMKAQSYKQTFGRGDFKGLDTPAITEILNTIGRIGVIDDGLVGSNGWYSGYICMHEPWLARVGTAINDPNYARSTARFLDYAREHAVLSDGMVKSRWKYDAGDAQAGTYDEKNGFYEAQWGRLMDSQTSYVTNVADQFDQTGDKAWVARQKESCESALEYLLRRDKDGDALVEMENSLTAQRRSSDWLDIVWASHENALVNGQLYGALLKWGAVERLLGDEERAARYLDFAAKLKASFNRPIAEGGFWNPAKGWYVYWRDADDSIHGDNLVVPVNLTALADGICDEPARRKALLDTIETRMNMESLVTWPSCFTSYQPGEGADDVFPKYENGDVFLAWAEYGVRAYAATQPEIALKYVRRIVDQYKKDGLAYQRYLRASGQGAGDDILANNGNVITGLYRDIYGIQPKHNRLLLAPNISPELSGTRVNYDLRGKPLVIDLSSGGYRVTHGVVTVGDAGPFGVDFGANRLTYFDRESDKPAFTFQSPAGSPLTLTVGDWSTRKRWTVASGPKSVSVTIAFSDLVPGRKYSVVSSGKPVGTVSAGQPSVKLRCAARASIDFDLLPRSAE